MIAVWKGDLGPIPFVATLFAVALFVITFPEHLDRLAVLLGFWVGAAASYWAAKASAYDTDHFWFIPLRFWPVILAIAGPVIIAVGSGFSGNKPAAPQSAPVAAQQRSEPAPQPPVLLADINEPPPMVRKKEVVAAEPEPEVQRIEQVYAHNPTKTYYPEKCLPRPEKAYPMAKSLAVRQGYKLAPACQP